MSLQLVQWTAAVETWISLKTFEMQLKKGTSEKQTGSVQQAGGGGLMSISIILHNRITCLKGMSKWSVIKTTVNAEICFFFFHEVALAPPPHPTHTYTHPHTHTTVSCFQGRSVFQYSTSDSLSNQILL